MAFAQDGHSTSSSLTPDSPTSPTLKLTARIRNLAANLGRSSGMFNRLHHSPGSLTSASISNSTKRRTDRSLDTFQQQIKEREDAIAELRKQVAVKDEQIAYLTSELDKYQSVFNQKPCVLGYGRSRGGKGDNRNTKSEDDLGTRKRAIGISAEPRAIKMDEKEHPKHYPKTAK